MNNYSTASVDDEMSIVVCTCDSYSDVMELFFAAWKEYWPTCSYTLVVNAENKTDYNYPAKVHNYKPSKKKSWGDRLIQTLNSIESDFVLITYDDFILEDAVSEDRISEILTLLKINPDIATVYLIDTMLGSNKESEVCRDLVEIDDYTDYRLNSAPAIWRRSTLLSYIGVSDDPWAWEFFGSLRTFGDGKKFYSIKSGSKDVYCYNYSKGGAIYRGRWVKAVVSDKFSKYDLDIDLSLRGFSEDAVSESRNIKWKINFFITGFKMVGFRAFYLFQYYIKAKLNAK